MYIVEFTRFSFRLFKQDNLNKKLQLPLSTLVVRWQPKRHVSGYTLSDLLSVFSQFGSIQQLRLLSLNSALVVFEEISSACRVMQYPYLGDDCNKMYSSWWHRCMENKYVRMTERGIKIKTDRFVKILQWICLNICASAVFNKYQLLKCPFFLFCFLFYYFIESSCNNKHFSVLSIVYFFTETEWKIWDIYICTLLADYDCMPDKYERDRQTKTQRQCKNSLQDIRSKHRITDCIYLKP